MLVKPLHGKKSLNCRAVFSLIATLFFSHLSIALPAQAQVVTWTQNNIGSTGIAGTYSYTPGTPPQYTIAGAGVIQPYATVVTGNFVSTPAAGDCELSGRVVSQSATGANAFAGFTMRDGVQANAYQVSIGVSPSGIRFCSQSHGGQVNMTNGPSVSAPIYLKLTRIKSGNFRYYTGYSSTDGVTWTSVGSYGEPGSNAVTMPNKFYAGFFVNSDVVGTNSTAVFDKFSYNTSIPPIADMLLWLRSDWGVTVSGASVTGWSDMSGNSNHAFQATGALQPTFSTGAVNNGILPAVNLNGTSQYLNLPSGFADLSKGATFIAVLSPTSSVATGTPFTAGNTSNANALITRTVGTNAAMYVFNGSTSSNVTTTNTPITAGSYQLVEDIFTPGTSAGKGVGKIYVNNVLKGTATNLVQTMINTTRANNYVGTGIGLTNYFGGGICELIVYAKPLNDPERNAIQAYILSKFGLGAAPTLELPTFSPGSGVFTAGQPVILSHAQDAVVHFTSDGSNPTSNSLFFFSNAPNFLSFNAPAYRINLTGPTTIKAFAKAPFFVDSAIATNIYQIDASTSPIPRSGLIQWLRADNVTLSGNNVISWPDISGSGNNASNASNQPTLLTAAVNNKAAVSFNGSQFLQMPTGFSTFSSGLSAFVVAKPVSVAANARYFEYGNGTANDNFILSQPSSTNLSFTTYNGATSSAVTGSSIINLGQFQLLEAVYNGSNTATLFTNGKQGAQSTSMSTLNVVPRSLNFLGQNSAGGNRLNGQIAEMLLYNRQVTSAERAAIEGYYINQYSLLNANSVSAPIISVASSTLSEPIQVAISANPDAKIFTTSDGSTPTSASTPYLGPIRINFTQTIKAIAIKDGISSSVASSTLTLDSTKWPAPSAGDTRPLLIEQQLPSVGIPHDPNQP